MATLHTLRLQNSSCSFIKFYMLSKDQVRVHGCWGASQYVDKKMDTEKAREYWEKKIAAGWHKCNNNLAPDRDWWFWD